MSNPNPFIKTESSRKLHDRLIQCDQDLSELEANISRYTIADYNRRFMAITQLRSQTRKAIEALEDSAQ